ncbi:MAG TPA: SusF/SusE family outer membrane protein [Saprospiraceae bacterium]|nr:SusF/SusE family outer membrane protein [Saprospiraceae bacterium]
MKHILKLSLLLVGLTALVFSCRKEELDLAALTDFPPGIASITPAEKEVVAAGINFDLKAQFVAGSQAPLASATIKLSNEGGNEIKSYTETLAGNVDSIAVKGTDFSASTLPVGKYTVTVEVKDSKGKAQTKSSQFDIGLIPQIGIIGSATAKGWGEDTDMTHIGNGVYEIVIELSAGEVKFRQDNTWTINWGAADFPTGIGTQDGPNIPVTAGKWKVTFKPTTGAYSFVNAVTYASNAKELFLLGSFNNFEGGQYPFALVANNTWVLDEIQIKPGTLFKFSEGTAFMGKSWGDNEGDFKADLFGKNISFSAPEGEAYYQITFNDKTLRYEYKFLKYPSIGLIGSATPGGWSTDTEMTNKGDGTFEVTVDLVVGEAKFRANKDWATNWGGNTFPEGIGTQNGPNIPISTAGKYKVTFNPATGAYKFTPDAGIQVVGIIGSATPTGWGSDTEMKNDGNGNFSILIGLDNGEVKFRANKDWAINWGAAAFPSGIGTQGGANIPVTKGIYLVTFNANTGAYNFAPASIGIIGSATPSGWGSDTNMNEDAAVGVVKVSIALSADEVKFRANDDWAINWGGSGFPTGVGTQGGPNIKIPAAGTYNVSFNVNTGEYSFTQ